MDVPGNQEPGPAAGAGQDARLSRLERLRRARGWSFQGSVGAFGAASSAGFDPVGQVFGTTVACLDPVAFDPCYVIASAARPGQTSADPYNPRLTRLTTARQAALERMLAECQALGGDGIVGARMSRVDSFTHTTEFTVEGTAVRARSSTRAGTPFTTHVSGQDLAKLLDAGWMPFALVFGTAIAARHSDETMFQQAMRGVGVAGNREVSGYTRLVNDARRGARKALEAAVRDQRGEGVVVEEMTVRFSERECPRTLEHSDYVVEATILGSAIVSFDRTEPVAGKAPLAIMRIDRESTVTVEPEPGPDGTAGPGMGDRAFAYWTARRAAQATGSSDEDAP